MFTNSRLFPVLILVLAGAATAKTQEKTDALIELQSQRARTVCAYYLDSFLSLSPEQAISIENLFAENWDPEFNRNTTYLVYNGMNMAETLLEKLDKEKLQRILDDRQYDSYEQLPTLKTNLSAQLNWMRVNENETDDLTDPLLPVLKSASELEVERLAQLLSLNEKQKSKLTIAAKGASKEIGKRRLNLKEKHGGDLASLLQRQSNLGTLMEGPLFQLTKDPVWTKSIENTLDNDQLEIYTADLTARYLRSKAAANYTIVLGYEDSNHPFSSDEYQGFSELVDKYLSDEFETNSTTPLSSVFFESFSTVLKIKDEELESVLSKDSYARIQPMLKVARERMEQYNDENDDPVDD